MPSSTTPPASPGFHLPALLKTSQLLLGVLALLALLYIGQEVMVPVLFSLLLAILLNPVVNRLIRWRVPKIPAIVLALLLAMLVLAGVAYFLGTQAARFSDSLPEFKKQLHASIQQGEQWMSRWTGMEAGQVHAQLDRMRSQAAEKGGPMLGQTLSALGGAFAFLFLLPVYTFLILFYKPLFLKFISMLFPREQHHVVVDVLEEVKGLVQSYLAGLLVEAAIVAGLNSAGLLLLGLEYAVLLGIIAALLNMVPYIGGLVAIGIIMLVALATQGSGAALGVLAVFGAVQFIDNNFIVPRVVASRVELNAFVSVVIVLVGGALWGVSGMFLSIPITAIIKVICDRVPVLTPFGYVLGDDQPRIGMRVFKVAAPVPKAGDRPARASQRTRP